MIGASTWNKNYLNPLNKSCLYNTVYIVYKISVIQTSNIFNSVLLDTPKESLVLKDSVSYIVLYLRKIYIIGNSL